MAVRRSAKQIAAAKRNLEKARRARRRVGGAVKAQRKYSRRKRVAKRTRTVRAAKNELKFYRDVGIRAAEKATGGKAKRSPKKGIAKRFVKGVKKNNADYKRSVKYAKRVRKNEVRRAIRAR